MTRQEYARLAKLHKPVVERGGKLSDDTVESSGTGDIMKESDGGARRLTRRDFIKFGAAAGGAALAATQLADTARANRHPAPRPTSLTYLDRNMYRKNTDVLAVFSQGHHRGNKMQMMAV